LFNLLTSAWWRDWGAAAVLADVLTQALAVGAGALSASLPAPYGLYFFILTVTLYTLSGAMSNPPWAALMGEYIPASKRGEFFGFRSQLVGLIFFAASFAASGILSYYGKGVIRTGGRLPAYFLLLRRANVRTPDQLSPA
jgi:MFS family permease